MPAAGGDAAYDAPEWPVYILSGAGGGDEGHSDYSDFAVPEWNAKWDASRWGHGILTFNSATELAWTQYDDDTGDVVDAVTITRKA